MKLINLLIIALSVASNPAAAADETNNKATVATNLLRGTFDSAFNLIMASNTEGCEGDVCSSDGECTCASGSTIMCCGGQCTFTLCCDKETWSNPQCPSTNKGCPSGTSKVTCPSTAEEDVEEVEEDVADRPPALIAANSS